MRDPLPGEPLTDRELVILCRLAEGLEQPEIARREHVTLNTVKTHCQHIYRKFGVRTAHGAVNTAHLLGLLPSPVARLTPEQKLALATEWLADPAVVKVHLAQQRAALAALEATS